MTSMTPPPTPPEGRPAGPAGPVPAVPVAGLSGSGLAGGSGAVAARDPQPKLEVEAEGGPGAGSDLEGGGGSAAGSDVEADGGPAAQEPEDGPVRAGTSRGPVAEGFEGDPTAWPPDEAFEAVELDDRGWTRRDLEAILLVADEPVPAAVLAEIVGARLSEVEELLVGLAGEYARDGRGFVLRAIAGGWRLYTSPGARAAVEAYLLAGQQSRLTRAALETLAVIAYRQPVTRFQVAAVRGVNVDGVFRTLASRGLIHEVGTDPGPGQATLYGTTPAFLEQLGLNSLDQLPPIKDYLPEGIDLLDLQDQP
jgi:segregation and condensation protein B